MTYTPHIATACVDEPASRHPAKTALIFDRGPNAPATTLSYAELARASGIFAARLLHAGFSPGERVLLNLPNCRGFPIAFFGCLKAGVIAVPTSIQLVDEELRFILRDCGARGLISGSERKALAKELDLELWLSGQEVSEQCLTSEVKIEPTPPGLTHENDPAYLVYSSGTTGRPKGVLHGHRSLRGRAPAATAWFDFSIDQRLLHSGQLNWTYVLGSGLMDPLLHGRTVILREAPATPECWPEMLARHRATTLIGVPALYRQILGHTEAGHQDLPQLRHCMSAGEALPESVRGQWLARFKLPIFEAVGMSECSYYLSQPLDAPLTIGSCGSIQPGHQVALMDDAMQPVPTGESGMLCINENDPGLFLGYWNEVVPRPTSHQQGWFLTGDYARMEADGTVRFEGRKDDLINTLGYRVSPYEVERVFRSHPEVGECICLGQTLAAGKTLLTLAVIPVPGIEPSPERLLAYGREHLARYKQPKTIHFMAQFPRTPNGKVLRRQLSDQLANPTARCS
ncbi:MAG: AMP-binding protein [Gammaproteobacteria bacterium]|nr:AMP-binding protein [Gammaproteobacteria bacterium]